MKIDHVEVFVPDRYEAASWYGRILGYDIVDDFEHWATEGGPLMIRSNTDGSMIALFEGTAQGTDSVIGIRRIAFQTNARGFVDFINQSAGWRDSPLGDNETQDHGLSLSVYFTDPYGNLLEVTTYEHEAARDLMKDLAT